MRYSFMISRLLLFLIVTSCVFQFSCKPKDEKITTDPKFSLSFSTDTILFDTVFTEKLTVSKRLIVSNHSENAVNIDRIFLNSNSPYSLIINGEATNAAENLVLRGNDEMIILVNAVLGKNNTGGYFIVEDSIEFLTNTNVQTVKLISWGRDAHFYTSSSPVQCDETWTNDKPHVIYDFVYVPPGCTLTIDPGTEVYVHGGLPFGIDFGGGQIAYLAGPSILVAGTLNILGNDIDPVTITDDRLEESYEHRPGLWGGIKFLASSELSTIQWAEISNAAFGIEIAKKTDQSVDVNIKNTIIRDIRYAGVYSLSADVDMENCLVTNCGQNSISFVAGGSYNINHCTFAEYQFSFTRNKEVYSVQLSNFAELSDGSILSEPLIFKMSNSIVWGEKGFNDEEEEISVSYAGVNRLADIDFTKSNILKTLDEEFNLVSSGTSFNQDPEFLPRDSVQYQYDYRLTDGSPAINAASIDNILSDDLNGIGTRFDGSPDIGAYEY